MWRSRCEPISGIPARRHARRTVEAPCPAAIGSNGALARRNTSRRSLVRPPALQIGGDRLADVGRQRQPVLAGALAAHHQLAGAPVDVIEPQAASSLRRSPSRSSEIIA